MTGRRIAKDPEGVGAVRGGAWGGDRAPDPEGAHSRRRPVGAGHFVPGTST